MADPKRGELRVVSTWKSATRARLAGKMKNAATITVLVNNSASAAPTAGSHRFTSTVTAGADTPVKAISNTMLRS